ncbi:MAG: Trm112 family protein [Planctomycetota bacterium]
MTDEKAIPDEFLAMLRCPACRSELNLKESGDAWWLTCRNEAKECGLSFPVEDGIPHLVVESARKPETP